MHMMRRCKLYRLVQVKSSRWLTNLCRFCVDPNGEDVEVRLAAEEEEDHEGEENPESGGLNCHFHAGVE